MAKGKREEKAAEKDGDYEFKLPDFDERAFIRKEIQSARASFITVGLGVAAGVTATILWKVLGPDKWGYGWFPLFGSLVILRPLLHRLGFGEDVTSWKTLAGSLFMLFFTGLAIWVLAVNFV